MSYDVMVFDHLKGPHELGQMRKWFHAHMENDVLPEQPSVIFSAFLKNMEKMFPAIDRCPENRLEYGCEYEIHEDFIYMCFGYSVAEEAYGIVKRQAKADGLGFWDVSQSFDRTFPITVPTDQWPMLLDARWIKCGRQFAYDPKAVQKVIGQMKTEERSSICLTDRYGNYMQAGGYGDTFLVEVRRYTDAVKYRHLRADSEKEDTEADTFVQINDFTVKVPRSQVFSRDQVCLLFQEFMDENETGNLNVFWKELEI